MTARARRLRVLRRLRGLWRNEAGATLVEYALVLLLFALLCVAGFNTLSKRGNVQYASSTNEMTTIQESPLPANTP